MTVITSLSQWGRKSNPNNVPHLGNHHDVERMVRTRVRRPHPPPVTAKKSYCHLCMLCFTFFTVVMLLLGATIGFIFYTDAHPPPRFTGYCSIPIEVPRDILLQEQPPMTLHWTSDPEVSVYSTLDEHSTDEAINNLLERFDIDDNVEKISVFSGSGNVEFIHDFNVNSTGIVDKKRCFMMELDPSVVIRPGVFVVSIERGAAFELARVRRRLTARLPPAPAPSHSLLADLCATKPVYHLGDTTGDVIRKRSVDEPAHDYVHFAGKNIQEITIDNLDELLEYEKHLTA